VVDEKIKTQKAELAKLLKDAPSQDIEAKSVAEQRSAYEVRAQGRLDNEAKGAARAAERREFRHKRIKDILEQLAILDKHLAEIEAENAVKYATKAAAAAEQDRKVLALFDQKIAKLAPQTVAPAVPAAGAGHAGTVAAITDANGNIADPATPEELRKAQEQVVQQTENLRVAAAKFQAEFERVVEIDVKNIPKAQVPDKEQFITYGALHSVLQQWSLSGAADAFIWLDLKKTAALAGDPVDVAKKLLGKTWRDWYKQDPEEIAIVPRHLALLIGHCLAGVKLEFDKDAQDQVDQMAIEGCHEIKESAKRRKM